MSLCVHWLCRGRTIIPGLEAENARTAEGIARRGADIGVTPHPSRMATGRSVRVIDAIFLFCGRLFNDGRTEELGTVHLNPYGKGSRHGPRRQNKRQPHLKTRRIFEPG